MTFYGHIHHGVVILEDPASLPEGTAVRIEPVDAPQANDQPGQRRQGGQYAGQIWMSPDFEQWPENMLEALGMKP